jgi:hypothetical protein
MVENKGCAETTSADTPRGSRLCVSHGAPRCAATQGTDTPRAKCSVQGAACSVPPWRQHCRVESEDRVTLQSVWSDVDLQPATLCNVIWARLPKVNLDGFDGRNLTKVSGSAARCCEYFWPDSVETFTPLLCILRRFVLHETL